MEWAISPSFDLVFVIIPFNYLGLLMTRKGPYRSIAWLEASHAVIPLGDIHDSVLKDRLAPKLRNLVSQSYLCRQRNLKVLFNAANAVPCISHVLTQHVPISRHIPSELVSPIACNMCLFAVQKLHMANNPCIPNAFLSMLLRLYPIL